jgi:hypothetical protein
VHLHYGSSTSGRDAVKQGRRTREEPQHLINHTTARSPAAKVLTSKLSCRYTIKPEPTKCLRATIARTSYQRIRIGENSSSGGEACLDLGGYGVCIILQWSIYNNIFHAFLCMYKPRMCLHSEELFLTCVFADVYHHINIESYNIGCVIALLPMQHPSGITIVTLFRLVSQVCLPRMAFGVGKLPAARNVFAE